MMAIPTMRGSSVPDNSFVGAYDSLAAPTFAFSTRRVLSAYTGYCMRVRRSSDSTTIDVGFTSTGDLDTASILSFIGANHGTVAIWYDQSGNAYDLNNPAGSAEPLIAYSGAILTKGSNNRPAVANKHTDATTRRLDSTSVLIDWDGSTKRFTEVFVAQRGSSTAFTTVCPATYYLGYPANTTQCQYNDGVSRTVLLNTPANGALGQAYFERTGNTAWKAAVNGGTLSAPGTCANSNLGTGLIRIPIPGASSSYICECVHWNSDQSANKAAIDTASLSYYGL